MSEVSRYKKIVVPLDGSGWSERAIPHATDIALNNKSEIILLHVYRSPAGQYTDQIAIAGQSEQIDTVREQVKQQLTSLRNQLRGQGIQCRVQFIEGVGVPHLICDYINDEDADLVVMSSHGRTGLGRFIFGSVARQVMEGVKVPVMIIRPGKDA
jgi:nucleotide-binding universal stress UspA family protein